MRVCRPLGYRCFVGDRQDYRHCLREGRNQAGDCSEARGQAGRGGRGNQIGRGRRGCCGRRRLQGSELQENGGHSDRKIRRATRGLQQRGRFKAVPFVGIAEDTIDDILNINVKSFAWCLKYQVCVRKTFVSAARVSHNFHSFAKPSMGHPWVAFSHTPSGAPKFREK
ncbi:unnamed protein product [Ectocarpus sp. 4 AP-2014]